MKAADIVNQLAALLPQLTDKFTDDVEVVSITRASTIMTVECSDKHKLIAGNGVAIVESDVPITISSLTRLGAVGTLVCAINHDLTNAIAKTIRITGSVESEFNGTFTRINIQGRTTITFIMTDSGPTNATGSPVLRDAAGDLNSYNSTFKVESTPTDSSFTFIHPATALGNPDGTIIARTAPRIIASLDIDQFIKAYTEKVFKKLWGCVVLSNVNASQSRNAQSDALDTQPKNANYRQQIIEPFDFYVFVPVSDKLLGVDSIDVIHDIRRPIFRSLLFAKFDTGLFAPKINPVIFTGHGVHNYNSSLHIHVFSFEQVADIYEEDTVGHDVDTRFDDIVFNQFADIGTQEDPITMNINLDDE